MAAIRRSADRSGGVAGPLLSSVRVAWRIAVCMGESVITCSCVTRSARSAVMRWWFMGSCRPSSLVAGARRAVNRVSPACAVMILAGVITGAGRVPRRGGALGTGR